MKSKKSQAGLAVLILVILAVIVALVLYYSFRGGITIDAELVINSAPTTAIAGQSFNVEVEVTNSTEQVSNLGIVYGNESISDPEDKDYTFSSGRVCINGCNIPGDFNVQVNINQSGTFYYRARADIDNETIFSDERSIAISPFVNASNCSFFYWYDNSSTNASACGYKQFCGTYMYEGLMTFATFSQCNTSFSQNLSNQTNQTNQGQMTYNVTITDFQFTPANLTIEAGDRVVWTNEGPSLHTVTSVTGDELDSGQIADGSNYSHIFEDEGTFSYYCTLHPTMAGTVIVEEDNS